MDKEKKSGIPVYMLPVYTLVAAGVLCAYWFESGLFRILLKPLMLIPLLVTVIIAGREGRRDWFVLSAALIFAWIGDVLLLFTEKGPLLFLLGMGAFFICQSAYVFLFIRHRDLSAFKRFLAALPFLLILAAFVVFASDDLGRLAMPIFAYSSVLLLMVTTAFWLFLAYKDKGSLLLFLGAVFFLISDFTIVARKFLFPIAHGGFLTMLTYAVGQFGIVYGWYLSGRWEKKENGRDRSLDMNDDNGRTDVPSGNQYR